MITRRITFDQWDARYKALKADGLHEPWYGGPLRRHVTCGGDLRLPHLLYDDSAASLRLWNFLLTENERLHKARADGCKIIGTMKDLGTVPVAAYSLDNVRAFYPDGAWWTPCLMECGDGLLAQAEALGIDASFCPVRAMLAAFINGEHFPRPDLLVCSTGAVCDDFSSIAQRLEHLGFPIEWWEMPRRREPDGGETPCPLPGGWIAPQSQVDCARSELERIGKKLGDVAGQTLDDQKLSEGIRQANHVRRLMEKLRCQAYSQGTLPALEMHIVEMLAIHFCSDREETVAVLEDLLAESELRLKQGVHAVSLDAVRVFWVNPVADIRSMNLLEEWGGRICGSDYMFSHALDLIPENLPPWEALAQMALADPMVGPSWQRADRIIVDCQQSGAEAVIMSRIPGASHCSSEGAVICNRVKEKLKIPVIELEIPPVCDAMMPALSSRIQALLETARARRKR